MYRISCTHANLTFPFKIKIMEKKLISVLHYYKSIKFLVLYSNLTFQNKKIKKKIDVYPLAPLCKVKNNSSATSI